MNGVSMGSEAAFADYVHRLVDVIGHADRAEPLNDYCLDPNAAGGPQECRASGGGDGASAGIGQASVATAFRRPSAVVGRGASGAGWRPGAAADRAAWAD